MQWLLRPKIFFCFLFLLHNVLATDSLGYTAVLVIVILELVFAFSIGVGCVLFSVNLVRSVYSSGAENEPIISPGDFPKAKISENRSNPNEEPLLDYNTFDESGHTQQPLLNSPSPPAQDAPLVDREAANNYRPIFGILKTFTDYIRIF